MMFPLCRGGNGGSKKLSNLPIDSQMPLPRMVIIHSTNIYLLPSIYQPFILQGEKLSAFSEKSSVPTPQQLRMQAEGWWAKYFPVSY